MFNKSICILHKFRLFSIHQILSLLKAVGKVLYRTKTSQKHKLMFRFTLKLFLFRFKLTSNRITSSIVRVKLVLLADT